MDASASKGPAITSVEHRLRDALIEFLQAAPLRDPQRTAAALDRILELERQLGPEADPKLRHYLERRSYQKALEFLQ